jgi:hypothetical protein
LVVGQQIILRPRGAAVTKRQLPDVKQVDRLHTVRGHVRNAESGEILINAQVYDAISGQGVLTNNYGFYSLSLKPGPVQLVAAEASYKKRFASFVLGKDTSISFNLPLFSLKEVHIVADEARQIQEETQMSSTRIPVEQIKQAPALLGEVDVVKVVQMLPGVQSGIEGSSGLYVRGGSPDQNLVLLDDVPLYTIGHLGGLFSVFNADAISTVKLTKGGFPARYGGRLSSILDIRMKDGNKEKLEADASLGLIAGKLTLNGPLSEKTTFLLSGRRTWLDLPLRLITSLATKGTTSVGFQFHDVDAKIVHEASSKDKLFFSIYGGGNGLFTSFRRNLASSSSNDIQLFHDYSIQQRWGNRLAAFRWNHIWNPTLFSNITATFSEFRILTRASIGFEESTQNGEFNSGLQKLFFQSGVRDLGLKADFEWYANPVHTLRMGGAITWHRFVPGSLTVTFASDSSAEFINIFDRLQAQSYEAGLYVEDEIRFGPRLSANVGGHLALFYTKNKMDISPQLRLAARYQAWDALAFKASFVQMTQYLHLLSSSGAGLPLDLWVPVTDRVPEQRATQLSIGMAASLGENAFELSIEAFYKDMDGLIEYREGVVFLVENADSQDWEDRVETGGEGEAYGIEFFLQKKTGRTKGWVGYTLSKNVRQFENLNRGEPFPYRFDRRHDISLTLTHDLSKRAQLGMNWVYGTGNAVNFPSGRIGSTGGPVEGLDNFVSFYAGTYSGYGIYDGGRNAARMEDYHRLDLSISFIKHKKKNRTRTWIISIYNSYNRLNPYGYYSGRESINSLERLAIRKTSLFPIIPMLTYSLTY